MAKARTLKKQKEAILGEIENLLESKFKPVAPRPAYVKDLNRRLSNLPATIPEIVMPRLPKDKLAVILGVIGGTVLLILGIKFLTPLIASLTTFYSARRKLQAEDSELA
jgi:hypothetical protein